MSDTQKRMDEIYKEWRSGKMTVSKVCKRMAELERENAELKELVAQTKEALISAEQFIENGVEFGYIRMPDPTTPDKAHTMLPEIKAALKAAERMKKK